MGIQQIALLSKTPQVSYQEIERVAEALNWQVTTDLARLWGVSAFVQPVQSVDAVPANAAAVAVCDSIPDRNAYGFHKAMKATNRPYALVRYTPAPARSTPELAPSWTLDASHECLEMLIDPTGNSLHPLPYIVPGVGQVDYLVEICDPCGRASAGYIVDGVVVSDFCTRAYYDSTLPAPDGYSCQKRLSGPLGLEPGGYVVWCQRDSTNQVGVGNWFMTTYPGGGMNTISIPPPDIFSALGTPAESSTESAREFVDRQSRKYVTAHSNHPDTRKALLRLSQRVAKASRERQKVQRRLARKLNTHFEMILHAG